MKTFQKQLTLIVLLCTFIFLMACGRSSETLVSQHSDAPKWVNYGAGAYDDDEILYGVGSSSVSDLSAARMQASDRARAEIASQIQVTVKALSKNFTTSKSGDKGVTTDVYTNVTENIVNTSVTGVSIVDYFRDPETKITYALAKLDLDKVKDIIDKQTQLNESLRSEMKTQMMDMFKELEKKTK